MPDNHSVDTAENNFPPEVLATLLRDQTTRRNIFWATHDYEQLGEGFRFADAICPECITGKHAHIIKPRVLKPREQQTGRSKGMAEVFTPVWVVKKMVDSVDFDIGTRCLELTCGEAPFLTSRYDATTGEAIALGERVGVLDRKLRLAGNRQLNDEQWLALVRTAFQTTYGYEWQGDSLLLARENLLCTFVDCYEARFGSAPSVPLMMEFAEIISWNLWQMDGLTYRIPREKSEEPPQAQLSLFDEAPAQPPAPLCIIKDWQTGKAFKVYDIKTSQTKPQNSMKFDVIIGNPPYQEEVEGNGRSNPVYNFFMDEAYKVGNKVELITPARFLFNAGQTPKAWNKKMLMDGHFKVLYYAQQSNTIFQNVDIKGGVSITYRDIDEHYGAIKSFIPFDELRQIKEKVISCISPKKVLNGSKSKYLSDITVGAVPYRFTDTLRKERMDLIEDDIIASSFDLRSNVMDNLNEILFFSNKPNDNSKYVKILGLLDGRRAGLWIKRDYISVPSNFDYYKVLLPESNGSGPFEILSTPVVVEPHIGHTQTFISMGQFSNRHEAENLLLYLKTKFCRALLGILKTTQHNSKATWAYVPLQDFTSSSDIDWSKSIAEIDEQLFDKYGLDEQERNFIRTKVKEMA